jgi:hypothetical protein
MFVICVVLCILLNTNDSNHLSVYDVDSRRGLFRYVSMLMLRQIRGGETQSVGFGVMETRAKMCQIILQNSQISWGICDEFVTCSKRTARPNRAQACWWDVRRRTCLGSESVVKPHQQSRMYTL